jgi:divinyl chlorophyllide a 8-vinyl-reductase
MESTDFFSNGETGSQRRVLLLGATGTIGLSTAKALIQRGHDVVCFLRPHQSPNLEGSKNLKLTALEGATIRYGDPIDAVSLARDGFASEHFDAVISCMASRTGSPRDAWRVDHLAHVYALEAAKAAGVKHFVLLSAICVQKPLLAFQNAKLAFEKTLIASGLTYSIVRPTAFFKSLSGQLERVKKGKPYLIFGDGQLTACKPISDQDLGDFIAGCLDEQSRHNRVLPIGGPGPAITPRQQGEYLFQLLGKEPRFKSVPVGFLNVIIGVLNAMGKLVPAAADKAELARIGRYYATESMLVWDAALNRYDSALTPSHGKQTLFEAYDMWANGQAAPDRGEHAVF